MQCVCESVFGARKGPALTVCCNRRDTHERRDTHTHTHTHTHINAIDRHGEEARRHRQTPQRNKNGWQHEDMSTEERAVAGLNLHARACAH